MDAIQEFITKVKIGGKQSHMNMVLYPLLMSDAGEPGYVVLEEALSKGMVEITEISHGGRVPELKLINKSPECVLIVDGEELMGAKQNRIVNATFLIGGNAEVIIPVSCVEHGRWSYRTNKFSSGEKVMPPSMRRAHQEFVAHSLKEGRGYQSNQGMIWDELAVKSERMAVHSQTGAMADLFEGHKTRLEDYLKAFRPVDCQVGAVYAINGEIAGLECFGYQQTFARFFRKLTESYALDALDWFEGEEKESARISPEAVKGFLNTVQKANRKNYPSLGLGDNIRFEGISVTGASLVFVGQILHISAFPQTWEKNGRSVTPRRTGRHN